MFIVGGGPAGLAAAIAARMKGFSVTVADARAPAIDKACGEGLLPDTVTAAAELGVAMPRDSYPFRGIRFIGEGGCATADFAAGCGYGVRRTDLHRALVECAERAGVTLLWNTPVTGIEDLRARWIIGADGERSRVRAWAGLDAATPRMRYGFRRHYRVRPWSDYVEVYWGRGLQIYIGPNGAERVCVTAICRDPHTRLDHALDQFPELRRRLEGAEFLSTERGAVSATRRLPAVTLGRVALVGDASGSVDVVTGAGVGLAFRQALALADALEAGDLRLYEAEHRNIMRRPRWMAELLLAIDRWHLFGTTARGILSARPEIFARLLHMHTATGRSPAPRSSRSTYRPAARSEAPDTCLRD